jgi:hypothetical protein
LHYATSSRKQNSLPADKTRWRGLKSFSYLVKDADASATVAAVATQLGFAPPERAGIGTIRAAVKE